MSDSPSQRALAASTVCLIISVACVAAFLPPMLERTLESILRTALVGTTLAVSQLLHWVFLGIGARRAGRSAAGWVALAVLLFPIGGVAALILLSWFGDESPALAPRA